MLDNNLPGGEPRRRRVRLPAWKREQGPPSVAAARMRRNQHPPLLVSLAAAGPAPQAEPQAAASRLLVALAAAGPAKAAP